MSDSSIISQAPSELLPENGPGAELLLTRGQVAKLLQVSIRTVDALIADGHLTPIRIRKRIVRFQRDQVELMIHHFRRRSEGKR